jgi:hypothetical protein
MRDPELNEKGLQPGVGGDAISHRERGLDRPPRAVTVEPSPTSRTGVAFVVRRPTLPRPSTKRAASVVAQRPKPALAVPETAQRATGPSRVEAIVQRMVVSLDSTRHATYAARSALSHLRAADPKLTHDQIMAVLYRLDREGRLGDFLIVSGEPEILTFLVRNGVPWPFILTNWNLSLSDTSLFVAGVAAGAAEDFIDGLRFTAKLAASPYIDNIAEAAEKLGLIDDARARRLVTDRDQFWDAIGAFVSNLSLELPFEAWEDWKDGTVASFLRLDFYRAGHAFGRMLGLLLTLPVAWRAGFKLYSALKEGGPKALATLKKLSATLRTLPPSEFLELVPRPDLQRFFDWLDTLVPPPGPEPALAVATAGGFPVPGNMLLSAIRDTLIVWSAEGQALGKVLLSEARQLLGSSRKATKRGGPGVSAVPWKGSARKTFRIQYQIYKRTYTRTGAQPPDGFRIDKVDRIWPNELNYPTVNIHKNGDVFGSYEDLSKYLSELGLTGGTGNDFRLEAHHLLEGVQMERFGIKRGEGRSVALEAGIRGSGEANHDLFTDYMAHHRTKLADIDEIVARHEMMYKELAHGEWVEDIRAFVRDNQQRIKDAYNHGMVAGADQPDWIARMRRVFDYLDSL